MKSRMRNACGAVQHGGCYVSTAPGCLAQLVERRLYTANVGSSSLSAPTSSIAPFGPSCRHARAKVCLASSEALVASEEW